MSRIVLMAFLALLCLAAPAAAQHIQPYAGMQARPIKAMSQDQIADLHAGRGMGLALAAELNGYPGPSHVIELAKELSLTPTQLERAQALFTAMKSEAVPLGEATIAAERDLDRLFAERTITTASLAAATDAAGAAQARLRNAHLKYHLAMVELLTADQVKRYGELRGYAANPDGHRPGVRHHSK